MTDKELKRDRRLRVWTLMGRGYLMLGEVRAAYNSYLLAGVEMPKGEFLTCGNEALAAGSFYTAREAFEVAEVEMPEDGLIACGNKALSLGQLKDAHAAFESAGHKEGLLICGNKLLEQGFFKDAQRAFASADAEIPEDKLIPCGFAALAAGRKDDAESAFLALAYIEESSREQ